MKAVFMIMLLAVPVYFQSSATLPELRRLYKSAGIVKDSSEKLSAALNGINDASVPLLYCYKGAAQLLKAKYSFNPVIKFSLFNEGRTMMETAIRADTASFEMRYLRLTVQSNLPAFLNYNESISRDKAFLTDHLSEQNDLELKDMAIRFLFRLDTITKTNRKITN